MYILYKIYHFFFFFFRKYFNKISAHFTFLLEKNIAHYKAI